MRYVKVKSHYRRVGNAKGDSCSGFLMLTLVGALLLLGLMFYAPALSALLFVALAIFIVIKTIRRKRTFIPIPSIDKRYISDALRRDILIRDKYQCCACHATSYLEIDHIIPLSKGGATSYENLQVLCRGCNMQKGNR